MSQLPPAEQPSAGNGVPGPAKEPAQPSSDHPGVDQLASRIASLVREQLEDEGFDPLAGLGPNYSKPQLEQMDRIVRVRQVAGYVLYAVGILGVGGLIWYAIGFFNMADLPANATPAQERFAYVKMAGRGLFTGGAILFSTKLVAAAERMTISPWWVNETLGEVDAVVEEKAMVDRQGLITRVLSRFKLPHKALPRLLDELAAAVMDGEESDKAKSGDEKSGAKR